MTKPKRRIFKIPIFSKKPAKTKKLAKSLKKIKLPDLISYASEAFELANKRIQALEKAELTEYSKALTIYREEGGTYFGESSKKRITKFDVLNELYRARTFLSDISSTVEGATKEKSIIQASQWANQLDTKNFSRYGTYYNQEEISKEQARLAFSIYHRLEQYDRSLIYGKAAYGSDTTIALVFEITKDAPYNFSDLRESERSDYIDHYLRELSNRITAASRAKDPYSIYNFRTDYQKVNTLITKLRRGEF